MGPGEENPELESAVEQATTEGTVESQTPPYVDDQGQADRLLQTSRQTQSQEASQQGGGKFYNGKYKTIQDYDKSHKSLEQQYGRVNNKATQLERLIQNPRLQEILAQDPEAREIMGKLGYQLMQEDERREGTERQGGYPEKWDINDPMCRVMVMEEKWNMQMERGELEDQLGRKLKPDEVAAIKQVIVMAPRLKWGQAWKLTPQFENEMKSRQEKALNDARARAPIARPRPAQPGGIGGPKGPQGKSPLGLKDEEKGQFLSDLIDKAERGG